MNYKEDLYSDDKSWDYLTQEINLPKKLYKYQSFYNDDGKENLHWFGNMNGEFHMSLGCEFEDRNDCKPVFSEAKVNEIIFDFIEEQEIRNKMADISLEEYFKKVESNYQKEIRIGCFTDKPDNEKMWNKYACMKKGYCIEFDTKRNKLFESSTLPVLYSNEPYDASSTLAKILILEAYKQVKNLTIEECCYKFSSICSKILKTAYIPVFIKNKNNWEFEREYRMFLLKNRKTIYGDIKMEKELDDKFNIDLSEAITAIYLGECFEQNNCANELLEKILTIVNEKKIRLCYQKNQKWK